MEQDPQSASQETTEEAGKGEAVKSPETPPEGQALQERMEKLEKSYQEAQRVIGRQGKELGELRKRPIPQTEETIAPDAFFTDPVNVTTKVVSRALAEFEARQEQKRQAERYLQEYAEEKGIPVRQLQALNERLQSASADPDAYLEMLTQLHQAQNTSEAIRSATQSAKDTATRNARAVTSESASANISPPGKSFDQMTGDEMREWIKKNYGEASF
jgi:hypothetical protein